MRTKTSWLLVVAIGCAQATPSQGQPMTPETKVTLDKLAELDGGGARLAEHAGLLAVATDENVTVWRDLTQVAKASSPATIDRVRFAEDGKQLLAAPYAFDLASAAWLPLGDL